MAESRRKYEKLMENEDLKRWYSEMARTSRITADTYLRRLGSFCIWCEIDPPTLVSKDPKDITDRISDYISHAEGQKLTGAYILSTVKAVKSWLTYNNVKLTRKIRISNVNANSTLSGERNPTQEELKRILASGDPRGRIACVLMAHSGMRPEVLGSYKGDTGIGVSDIPDMKIHSGVVSFEKIPAMIVVRPELSKSRKQYITFLGNEGCFYLKAYLEERIAQGENITGESSIITPSKFALRSLRPHITTINVGDIVRGCIRSAGFNWRPYVLRSYFDTQLMLAESKGFILRDYRQFFMGHVGDIEHRYTVNKQRLPDEIIEDMRSAYGKCLKFLETEEHGIKEEDYQKMLRTSAIEAFSGAFGITLSEDQKEELLSLDTEEYQKRLGELFKDKRADLLNNGNKHKTTPEIELESYLNKGWELVQIYPRGDKAVVRLPS